METNNQTIEQSLYIPDSTDPEAAFGRTTHLAIGAHQDDLEFMALSGILECYAAQDKWFGGIICTDGRGSVKAGPFAHLTAEQLMEKRVEEQKEASRLGEYSFIQQLGYPSEVVKDPQQRPVVTTEIVSVLTQCQPEVLYLHNPFDKHLTHLGVLHACIDAVRQIPQDQRPAKVLGCEVWRSLDWLPEELKVVLPVDDKTGLGNQLAQIFESQIGSGKAYDRAVSGRRSANATFADPHSLDGIDQAELAVDLTPLFAEKALPLETLVRDVLYKFTQRVLSDLGL